jgi:hypothetical protein
LRLNFGERFRVTPLRLLGIARAETALSLALAHGLPQIIRQALEQPINSAVWMLGTCHWSAMCTTRVH